MSSPSMHKTPQDHQVRQDVLDPSQSFVVTAPAGSGKTSLLTQRALILLAQANNPESVLCITFTRKAAAEMRTRIIRALVNARDLPCPNNAYEAVTWHLARTALEQDLNQAWHIIDNPHRLRITTIDGLCRSITQQLPMEAQISLGMATLEDATDAYRAAAQEVLAWLEKSQPLYQTSIKKLLLMLDGNSLKLEELFCQLLAKRDQWLPFVMAISDSRAKLHDNIAELAAEQLAVAAKHLHPVASQLATIADQCATALLDAHVQSDITLLQGITGLPPCDHNALAQWRGLADILLTKQGKLRKKIDKSIGIFPGSTKSEKEASKARKMALMEVLDFLATEPLIEADLSIIAKLPPAEFSDDQWQTLEYLISLLPLLVAHLKTHFANTASTDFIEQSLSALSALDGPTVSDTLLKLDNQIHHILVDEFQDTSTSQLQLLELLTSGWQPDEGKTLFLVGDGMQSCYQFRGAEVGLFLHVRQNGLTNVPLQAKALTTNFRSNHQIVDWVNKTFGQAFPTRDDISVAAVSYNPSIAFKQLATSDELVTCTLIASDQKELARIQEAKQVVELIQSIRANHPDESIAVLVRARSHLTEINRQLDIAGLIPQATEIEPLGERQAILDLQTLTRAMLFPSDELAWYSMLRAPYCALSPDDMLAIKKQLDSAGQSLAPWLLGVTDLSLELSEDSYSRLVQLQQALTTAWQNRRRKSLRHWLEGLWLSLGGAANFIEQSDVTNADTFWQLVQDFDDAGTLSDWPAFVRALDKLYAAPKFNACPQIHIMTIHKSKGLEFDHVIIPGLDKSSTADSRDLLTWQTQVNNTGGTRLLVSALAHSTEDNRLYEYLRWVNKAKLSNERLRLFYVGCTRAIKSLQLLGCVESREDGTLKPPANGSMLAPIWPQFQNQASVVTPTEQRSQADLNDEIAQWHKIRRVTVKSDTAIAQTDLLTEFRGHEYNDDDNVPVTPSFNNYVARAFGTSLHLMLESIATTGIENWSKEQIAQYSPNVKSWLSQQGLQAVDGYCQRICEIATRLLEQANARWILSNQHDHCGCEVELLDVSTDQIYIVDRTFVADGKRWIIDYKSSSPKLDQSLADFLEHEISAYTPQLENYARLYRAMGEPTIAAALYFPLIDELAVIDV